MRNSSSSMTSVPPGAALLSRSHSLLGIEPDSRSCPLLSLIKSDGLYVRLPIRIVGNGCDSAHEVIEVALGGRLVTPPTAEIPTYPGPVGAHELLNNQRVVHRCHQGRQRDQEWHQFNDGAAVADFLDEHASLTTEIGVLTAYEFFELTGKRRKGRYEIF